MAGNGEEGLGALVVVFLLFQNLRVSLVSQDCSFSFLVFGCRESG